jgi:hypothetical protein
MEWVIRLYEPVVELPIGPPCYKGKVSYASNDAISAL